ncbi:MAG: 4a-hydroxytetrahydrobiopterin dehydratase [Xanthomonadales bacterium]|nr:putative pterin-4-alpha-carbinolamine dehydratase [Xanthomonadales bacterium]MCC6592496.1 4a-hydroxytetrahydrobiopterin dehydratase [Xanthomonadales bacterium]MCE7932603.1 4a-hydroxytetrahydrobiopterin dehydratase [Xanthomonadales bacterium PRO6]
MTALADQHCVPRRGEAHRLSAPEVHRLLAELPGWALRADGLAIVRTLRFEDFLAALAYVNALADMAEAQDHHPDLELGYGRCSVHYNTHDVGGLSLNDFICAAKAERLYAAQHAH